MADELGDYLWFAADTATRLGWHLSVLGQRAIGKEASLGSFLDLEAAIFDSPASIALPRKSNIGRQDEGLGDTALHENPGYVLQRLTGRLIYSLRRGERVVSGPPNAAELEGEKDLDKSLGNFVAGLAYVAKYQLGISLQTIAEFNLAKLKNREVYGKENDIGFDAFLREFDHDTYATIVLTIPR